MLKRAQVFDHSSDGQLLYFKERLLPSDHPRMPDMQAFSVKIRKLGIPEQVWFGPTKPELAALLENHGLNSNLNKISSAGHRQAVPAKTL